MAAADKLKHVKDVSFKAIIFGIARVPKSTRFYLASSDFKVHEIDLSAAKIEPKELYGHGSYVTGIALSGKTLISGGYDGKLIWWDTEKNKEIRNINAHSKWIRKVIINPNGKLCASVADDMVCRVWEVETGKKVHELRGHQETTPHHFSSMLYAVAFSPDGKYLATGDKVGHIVVWDVVKGTQVGTVESPVMYTWDPVQRLHSIGGIRSLAFSPDSKLLAVGGTNKIGNIDHLEAKTRIEIFEWAEQKKYHEFTDTKFTGLTNYLRFGPKGDWLLTAGGANEGFLMTFDIKGKKMLVGEKVGMHVHDVALNEEADTIYCAGHNKIAIWEMKG